MAHSGNGHITSNGNAFSDEDDNKPMLLMKKSIDSQGNGLTALINKQLQGKCENHQVLLLPSSLCLMYNS
jgi:hypothetical protein